MKTLYIKNIVYIITVTVLLIGGIFACRMDELASVRAPAKRGNDTSHTQTAPYLETLSLSDDIALEPVFAPAVFFYTAQLKNPPPVTVTITATAAAGLGIDYKTGQTFAPSPARPAQIVVTNPEGIATSYIIVFKTEDENLPAARLKDIKLSQGTIGKFDPDRHDYELHVPYGTKELVVIPIGEDTGSLFTVNPAVTITPVEKETKLVTIGVAAPNRSLGTYTVKITVEEPDNSRLLQTALSAGSLVPAFAPETFTYEIHITEGVTPFVVDAVRIHPAVDTVRFTELPGGAVIKEGATAAFDTAQGSLNGKMFTITVHQGIGYKPADYTFKIITSANPPALLESLAFTDGVRDVGVLKQGAPDNLTGGTGFDAQISVYTLEFAGGTSAEMTAKGKDRAEAVSGSMSGNSITIPYSPLQASQTLAGLAMPVRNFVTITAKMPFCIDTTYTVYFKKTPLTPAALDSLTVYGGTLMHTGSNTPVTDDDVKKTATFDGQNKKQYRLIVPAHTPAVIVEGTPKAPASMHVTYSPKNFADNLQQGVSQVLSVHVADGLEYADSTYELTVDVLAAQIPRIELLKINAAAITLDTSKLVYTHKIPYNKRPPNGRPEFAWKTASSVRTVEYSYDSGVTWIPDQRKTGFAATAHFEIDYLETKPLLVKLRAADGTEAVYTFMVMQEGNPDNSLTISNITKQPLANFGTIKIPTPFQNVLEIFILDTFDHNNTSTDNPNNVLTEIYEITFDVPDWAILYTHEDFIQISNIVAFPVGDALTRTLSLVVLPQSKEALPVIHTVIVKREYSRLITENETWRAPFDGTYQITAFGAKGQQGWGSVPSAGGYGGWSKGDIQLTKGDELDIFIGKEGNKYAPPASIGGSNIHYGVGFGGGASDIRQGGTDRAYRIMVAGGGGGGGGKFPGGAGGGGRHGSAASYFLIGEGELAALWNNGVPSGLADGKGGSSIKGGGGGSGYYGGSASQYDEEQGGGGGSGYIADVFYNFDGGRRALDLHEEKQYTSVALNSGNLTKNGFVVIRAMP